MEYAVTFTDKIIRNGVYLWWRSIVGWHAVILGFGLFALSVCLFLVGNRSWYVGVLGSVAFLGILVFVSSYYFKLRQSLKFLGHDNRVKYKFSSDYFSAESGVGRGEIKWGQINKVIVRPRLWLLFLSRGQCITLPVEELSEEGKRFILTKIKAAGGKIA